MANIRDLPRKTKNMEKRYVLILTHLDQFMNDIAQNKYPIEGFVQARKFTSDYDIRYGLYGILWGKTTYFPPSEIDEGYWIVSKTEKNSNLIKIDDYHNRYKFECGMVLFSGNLRSAANFIVDNKDDPKQLYDKEAWCIRDEEIAGTKEWFKKRKSENSMCR